MRLLVAWIGRTDLNAAAGEPSAGLGPIARALDARPFEQVVLLSNYPQDQTETYRAWIAGRTRAELEVCPVALTSPTHFGEIYSVVIAKVDELLKRYGERARLTFHLSPGTPAMAAVWIIVAKTRFGAELIESSPEQGVRTAEVPFDLSAEYIPDLYRRADRGLLRLGAGLAEEAPEFADIVYQGPAMRTVVVRARRVAARSVPVLIEGESGTGKEMLARAIHRASPRRGRPFVAVNCGAVSPDLAESEFFGHRRGAFTGAVSDRVGWFETADGGTLFLDEIGELGLGLQVKLLRVIQEAQVVRVGTASPRPIDVRIIAATNRILAAEVAAGRFRGDLFFRLAVALIRLPPLREREGDFRLLAERLLVRFNEDNASDPGWEPKTLSPAALNRLARHAWPGNVRELANTLARAALWSDGPTVAEQDVEDALLDLPSQPATTAGLLDYPIAQGVDLPDLIRHFACHYLRGAMDLTGGNKTRAAKLLGLSNYQTLTNWMVKYGIAED
jgi:DNA-binding NtrC family response regulator